MATEVRLPDMGEGIEDVTVSRWRVKVGDSVKAGDVIVEVATDKVDSELPAPVSGTIIRILAEEGSLVPVSCSAGGDRRGQRKWRRERRSSAGPKLRCSARILVEAAPEPGAQAGTASGAEFNATPVAKRVAADKGVALGAVTGTGPGGRITKEDVLSSAEKPAGGRSAALPGDLENVASLAVRRVAALNNLDLEAVAAGRPLSSLNRYDVLSAVASRNAGKPVTVAPAYAAAERAPAAETKAAPPEAKPAAKSAAQPVARPAQPAPGELKPGEELVKHSRMRAAVARNTTQSLFTAPHVTTMWDVDMSAVLAHRAANKKAFAAEGVNLTITAYFVEAVIAALRAVPAANASWTDEGVIIKRDYNIGMAVALARRQVRHGRADRSRHPRRGRIEPERSGQGR